jgi:hypothetical protein
MAHSGTAIFFNRFFDKNEKREMVSVRVNKKQGFAEDSWVTVADFYAGLEDAHRLGELLAKL